MFLDFLLIDGHVLGMILMYLPLCSCCVFNWWLVIIYYGRVRVCILNYYYTVLWYFQSKTEMKMDRKLD